MADISGSGNDQAPPKVRFGLSGKLLVLTVIFVLIAEILIFVPSVANFRVNWLNDRLSVARTAALVLEAAPAGMVSDDLARELLSSVGAQMVAMRVGGTRRLLAVADMPPLVERHVDLRALGPIEAIMEAFDTLLAGNGRTIRVIGEPPMHGDFVEIVLSETPLRDAMLRFGRNITILSLIIAGVTAALVYLALSRLFVRPVRRLTDRMVAFRQDPENPARVVVPSGRGDEIGVAERELAAMQVDIASMLASRNRLAALGLAVSKINHELRNLLASAQLFSERLATVKDPAVQRVAPKLEAAIERAIAFCEATLSYGRVHEAPPMRRIVALSDVIEEVRDQLGLGPGASIGWVTAVERGLTVDADPDQLFRVLVNLGRNARQALETRAPNDPSRDQIRVSGRREGSVVVIEVSDTGPGVPEKARAHLFEAFQGSTTRGGTGLGLAIAAELVRAHGGTIALGEGTLGASFRLTIPDRPVELDLRRARRAPG